MIWSSTSTEKSLDDLLGPVFGEVAEVDWAVHRPRLIDYWSQVLRCEPGYDGAILRRHRYVHGLEPLRLELSNSGAASSSPPSTADGRVSKRNGQGPCRENCSDPRSTHSQRQLEPTSRSVL